MKINVTKLRAYLDTMHGHANARDLQSESIRKVVGEAKKDGFDTKALRKVFVRERMEPEKRQTEDDMLAAYETALGGKGRAMVAVANGATLDEAAEIGGVHRATVARARAVAKQASNATPPHDPETGELPAAGGTGSRVAEDVDGGEGAPPQGPESEASLAGEADAPAPIAPEVIAPPVEITESCGGVEIGDTQRGISRTSEIQPEMAGAGQSASGANCPAGVATGPQDLTFDEIAGPIPPALIRTREAAT